MCCVLSPTHCEMPLVSVSVGLSTRFLTRESSNRVQFFSFTKLLAFTKAFKRLRTLRGLDLYISFGARAKHRLAVENPLNEN